MNKVELENIKVKDLQLETKVFQLFDEWKSLGKCFMATAASCMLGSGTKTTWFTWLRETILRRLTRNEKNILIDAEASQRLSPLMDDWPDLKAFFGIGAFPKISSVCLPRLLKTSWDHNHKTFLL